MIKSPFCGAYKIIILGHNHLCLTLFYFVWTVLSSTSRGFLYTNSLCVLLWLYCCTIIQYIQRLPCDILQNLDNCEGIFLFSSVYSEKIKYKHCHINLLSFYSHHFFIYILILYVFKEALLYNFAFFHEYIQRIIFF